MLFYIYPYRVDSIKQTYKHGYIYIYKHEHTNQSYIKTNIIIMQLYWVHPLSPVLMTFEWKGQQVKLLLKHQMKLY